MLNRILLRLAHARQRRELQGVWLLWREVRVSGESSSPYWVEWCRDYRRMRWLVAYRMSREES